MKLILNKIRTILIMATDIILLKPLLLEQPIKS